MVMKNSLSSGTTPSRAATARERTIRQISDRFFNRALPFETPEFHLNPQIG